MSETIVLSSSNKKSDQYEAFIPQLEALLLGETNLIANLANTAAALKQYFNWFWVGFYLVDGHQLVLGPFQGTVACTRIDFGKGVCGSSWKANESLLVPDVNLFPGHIACSSLSVCEVVIPIRNASGNVVAVIDVDSHEMGTFDEADVFYLEKIALLLSRCWK